MFVFFLGLIFFNFQWYALVNKITQYKIIYINPQIVENLLYALQR